MIFNSTGKVVVVETKGSIVNGPRSGCVVDGEASLGIVVVVLTSLKQFVFFLNFPTLLFEPKASRIIILALYFASSGTLEMVVIYLEDPAGIV